MKRLCVFALAVFLAQITAPSLAQPYPNKPIKVVVPSPPGGPPDLIIRMLAPEISASLGQPLVI